MAQCDVSGKIIFKLKVTRIFLFGKTNSLIRSENLSYGHLFKDKMCVALNKLAFVKKAFWKNLGNRVKISGPFLYQKIIYW